MSIFFAVIFWGCTIGIAAGFGIQLLAGIKSQNAKLKLLLGLLSCLPIFGMVMMVFFRQSWPYLMNVLSFSILVCMLWFVMYAVLGDITRWITRRFKPDFSWLTFSKINVIAFCGVLISLALSLPQPFCHNIKYFELSSPRIPIEADGYTIMLISDMHFGTYGSKQICKIVNDYANDIKPDLILHAGDLVDSKYTRDASEQCDIIARTPAPDGIFGVLGNHDCYASIDLSSRIHQEAGITLLSPVLQNPHAYPRPWLHIAGIDDEALLRMKASSTPVAAPDCYNILLKHRPGPMEDNEYNNYQLMLNGHTHGGQIFPFSIFERLKNPYATGKLYQYPDAPSMYICQGTGYWGPPMRFLIPPEIVIFTLKHSNSEYK